MSRAEMGYYNEGRWKIYISPAIIEPPPYCYIIDIVSETLTTEPSRPYILETLTLYNASEESTWLKKEMFSMSDGGDQGPAEKSR